MISVCNQSIPITIVSPNTPLNNGTLVFLHAGFASAAQEFMETLVDATQYIAAIFDYRGTTKKTRKYLDQTNLETRVEDAEGVVMWLFKSLCSPQPFVLWGHSMGSYLAARLAGYDYRPDSIILSSPVTYRPTLLKRPFGKAFPPSSEWRQGWHNSDGPTLLADYPGKLLVLPMQHDEVMPLEVANTYYFFAKKTSRKKLVNPLPFTHNQLFDATPEGEQNRTALLAHTQAFLEDDP